MGKSIDEFYNSSDVLKLLVENLEDNMETFCEEMHENDKEDLMRTNLIVIRQALEHYGVG